MSSTSLQILQLPINKKVSISGFITSIRIKSNIIFLVLTDISGSLQIVITTQNEKFDHFANIAKTLTINSTILVKGIIKSNPSVKLNGKEMIPNEMEVLSLAPSSIPIDTNSLIDNRLDYRWIDLRSEKNQLIFKVQTLLSSAIRKFLLKKNFIEIHTPKIIGTASESGSEVFEISNYFGKKAYLAQSPQFYKQMCIASGFDRVFEFGPVFRAENSHTNRHCTEFTGFDLEFSNVNDVSQVMQLEQEVIIAGFKEVKKKYNSDIKRLFNTEVIVPKKIPIVDLKELLNALKEKYNYVQDDISDLTSEGEKMACKYALDKYNSEFLFVIGYDKKHRPFYHYRDQNGIPQGFDLLYRGVEITSGAKREHRHDILVSQAKEKGVDKDIEFYLQFFKYGILPHGGLGLGFDRLVMLMLGITIKEACLCYRGPERLNP